MRATTRALTLIAGFLLALMVLGFFVFAGMATRRANAIVAEADGIVVLTGAEFRIAEGARLLERKRGKRLLITGVNPQVSRGDLLQITKLPAERFECCVDVDTKALDTIGNAREAKTWIERHGYSSVILVTSNFHMPRSLAEFALAMPGVRLQPHPVVPRDFPKEAWWLHGATARLLLSEYLKFLPSALRLAAARTIGTLQSEPVAVTGDGPHTRSSS